jgi:hypothetical protein
MAIPLYAVTRREREEPGEGAALPNTPPPLMFDKYSITGQVGKGMIQRSRSAVTIYSKSQKG